MPNEVSIHYAVLSFFILLLGINSSFAHEVQPTFTFSAGASLSSVGRSQSFEPLDRCSYHYNPYGSNTNMLWGGFIGSEIKPFLWGLIAGFSYYRPNVLSTTGTLTQGADPMSNNTYSYQYQTQSQQFLAETKWYWIAKETIQPFLMVGIGAALNTTSNYQTNVPSFLEFTPLFSNHTQTSFTYAVGPGIDVSLTKSFRLGVGYRFTDLGKALTGSAQLDTIPISSALKQSHIYANQILAQFTFMPQTKG